MSARAGLDRDPGLDAAVPFRFACHRCGNCCSGGQGFVWLAEGETAALAHALGLSEEAFVERYVRRVVDPRSGEAAWALREDSQGGDAGGRCVLLEGPHTCRAYAARPAQCREFPYWPSVMAEERAFETARATCPGIAVEVPRALRDRAFALLEALHGEIDAAVGPTPEVARGACCLVRAPESAGGPARAQESDLFATALEADFALCEAERAPGAGEETGCRLGRARPLGCRLDGRHARRAGAEDRDRARFFERLRSIERETGYPRAYARLAELLRARGLVIEGGGGTA